MEKGNVMESVCYAQSSICLLSFLVNTTMALIVLTPFAATRLLVLRMRAGSGRNLQLA
ncbi:hypothetical protein X752_14590 [Mesorhizobium sp. LNJC398B00]|nr:hypothetical protein X752_14590 [Mesorhizobium sp. LNJC398B00]